MIEYRRKEALRYLRAKPGDKAAEILADTAYLKLRNEVQARSVLLKFACQVETDKVRLANGVEFFSAGLAKHLRGCREALLFAATLGSKVDLAIRRIALVSVAEGAAAQAVAAALIESYCDGVLAKTDTGGLFQRPRFSPGYGDWRLEEQRKMFAVLDCAKKIGLTLTEGLMMAPSKSVTAIIGLSVEENCAVHKCVSCDNHNCQYREE